MHADVEKSVPESLSFTLRSYTQLDPTLEHADTEMFL
jgi:hypothetical protein